MDFKSRAQNSRSDLRPLGSSRLTRIFLGIIVFGILAGVSTGYALAKSDSLKVGLINSNTTELPKSATADTRTFKDFAEGTVQKKPDTDSYSEGTHLLVRPNQVPVALTSSVVDLSQYEGKKVKVLGETQKAIKEGWLMDVGRVEELK